MYKEEKASPRIETGIWETSPTTDISSEFDPAQGLGDNFGGSWPVHSVHLTKTADEIVYSDWAN